MNIPHQGNYGVLYGTGTNEPVDPGNKGSFVGNTSELESAISGTDDGINGNYGSAANFDTSCGLIFQREAAGVVEAMGPQVQVTSGDISVVYQGDVILGRLAMGADFLNPAACVELYATDTAPTAFGTTYPANAS